MPTRPRAEPLAPDERRRAIVDAVIPLLVEAGPNLTTVRIAEAAGVAEGTIFRVFSDKAALLHEACRASFDPERDLEALANIERELPFEIKLRKSAAILLKRSERLHALGATLRTLSTSDTGHEDIHRAVMSANSMLFREVVALFNEHSDDLAVDPARAAAAFRGLLYAVSFPLHEPDEMIDADDAIEILLDGVQAKRPEGST